MDRPNFPDAIELSLDHHYQSYQLEVVEREVIIRKSKQNDFWKQGKPKPKPKQGAIHYIMSKPESANYASSSSLSSSMMNDVNEAGSSSLVIIGLISIQC
jgi:hypothetical protein